MKLKYWMRRVSRVRDQLKSMKNFKSGKYVLLMSPRDYDSILTQLEKSIGNKKWPYAGIQLGGVLLARIPTIGKRKWQVMTSERYLAWIEKYKKAGRFQTGKVAA